MIFKFAARSFAAATHQEGKRFRGARFRQEPLNAQLQADLEWRSLNYREMFVSQASSSSSPATWWKTDNDIGGIQQNATNHTEKNDTVKIAGKSKGYRLIQAL